MLTLKIHQTIDQGQSMSVSLRQYAQSQTEQQRLSCLLQHHTASHIKILLNDLWQLETSIKGLHPEHNPWLQLKQVLLKMSQPIWNTS